MKIVKPSYKILTKKSDLAMYKEIESVARTCYKSENHIKDDGSSAKSLVTALIRGGHMAMFDHEFIRVKFICDRGISHELVRHRHCAFAQESTRYCNYANDKFGNEITVIEPYFFKDSARYSIWKDACESAEKAYFELLETGASPQEARSVLPNSLKTEIVVTADITEWRHIFEQRTAEGAHPQMRELMLPLLADLNKKYPLFFGDIQNKVDAQHKMRAFYKKGEY